MNFMSVSEKYQVVVGLEVHVQLNTNTKIFSADPAVFGDHPNENTGVITLAHPGAMPKLNKKVIGHAIKMGLACHCDIAQEFIFDRKNYFYPDLPKGYQLTQDRTPICDNGYIFIRLKDNSTRHVKLFKIHLEEDAGKSIHDLSASTHVDYNRAGVPLIEIVTQPDISSAEEAAAVLGEVRRLVRYLNISDGNMEEGSMRCDANISVKLKDATELGKKVEIKNMNSLRNVGRAIEYETKRQIQLLEAGEDIISETRTFNADDGTTAGMRTKEELNDYRYFPEPDLSSVVVSDEWLEEIRSEMPHLPQELFAKFTEEYKLPPYDAGVLIDDQQMAQYAEKLFELSKNKKTASNWLMGPVKSWANEKGGDMRAFPVSPERLQGLLQLVNEKKVSHNNAVQKVFPQLLIKEESALQIAEELHLIQGADDLDLKPVIEEILGGFPDKVKAYKNGKKGLLGMFMGEVMKKTKGKVDAQEANQVLRELLDTQ